MASSDNHTVSEGTHNAVISQYMAPNGYACDKLYCYTYSASSAQVMDALNDGRSLAVYSGHGSDSEWADGPVFYASDIASLTNLNRYPFACSFACLTGHYSVDECFAESWQRADGKGGVAILASSVYSYWTEDDILEKSLFSALYGEHAPSVGTAIWRAKQIFLQQYGGTATTIRYFEQYNLFGDPTLPLLGMDFCVMDDDPPPILAATPYAFVVPCFGGTRPYTAQLLSGSLPPGLTLNPTNLTVSGISSTNAGSFSFVLQMSDTSGAIATHAYSISVTTPVHLLTPTNLFFAITNRPYLATLACSGGASPYRWESHEEFVETIPASGWLGGGSATGWKGRDHSWKLSLPWPFPFWGQTYTSLWVCSNGYLDFGTGYSDHGNTLTSLASNKRVAPLWCYLALNNIYVSNSPSRVAIRWDAREYYSGLPISLEAVLNQDGSIQFNYGSTLTTIAPTIGIGGGSNAPCAVSIRNGAASIPAYASSSFTPMGLPVPLVCSTNGVISGTPAIPGTNYFRVNLSDSSLLPQSTNALFQLITLSGQECTSTGVPLAWLVQYNLTNADLTLDDTLDPDGDGMTACAEYLAGTDPTNAASALRFTGERTSNGCVVLRWLSANSPVTPTPPYLVWTCTNLLSGGWSPVTNIVTRTPPTNEIQFAAPTNAAQLFYRITITN